MFQHNVTGIQITKTKNKCIEHKTTLRSRWTKKVAI